MKWQHWWKAAVNAVFPQHCLFCGKEGTVLCPECWDPPPVKKGACSALSSNIDHVSFLTMYHDPTVERIIQRWKFGGEKAFSSILATKLYQSIAPELPAHGFIYLQPIPMPWQRQYFSRGYNQVWWLARELKNLEPRFEILNHLRRRRYTPRQTLLTGQQRPKNVADAFVWKGASVPQTVFLLDDIVTTGSTLDAAAQELKAAGVKKVCALALART